MNLNNIKMIMDDDDEEEYQEATFEFILKHVKKIKEEIEVIVLYHKIQQNKELLDELIYYSGLDVEIFGTLTTSFGFHLYSS